MILHSQTVSLKSFAIACVLVLTVADRGKTSPIKGGGTLGLVGTESPWCIKMAPYLIVGGW